MANLFAYLRKPDFKMLENNLEETKKKKGLWLVFLTPRLSHPTDR
jgi:hypothetical protein